MNYWNYCQWDNIESSEYKFIFLFVSKFSKGQRMILMTLIIKMRLQVNMGKRDKTEKECTMDVFFNSTISMRWSYAQCRDRCIWNFTFIWNSQWRYSWSWQTEFKILITEKSHWKQYCISITLVSGKWILLDIQVLLCLVFQDRVSLCVSPP